MIAVEKKNVECVRCLAPIEGGLTNDRGETAMQLGAPLCDPEVARDLVRYEAGHTNGQGITAWMSALVANNIPYAAALAPFEAHLV